MRLPREELDERVLQLHRFRSTLVEQMRSAATLLLSPGMAPAEELETSLDDYRLQLRSLQFDLELDSSEDNSAWAPIESRLNLVRRAAVASQSLIPLEHLRISAGDQGLLKPVHNETDRVRSQLEDSPWQHADLLEDIAEHRHPLCRLILLLQAPQALSDADWTTEMSLIQEHFGIPVATAIARGRVELVPHETED